MYISPTFIRSNTTSIADSDKTGQQARALADASSRSVSYAGSNTQWSENQRLPPETNNKHNGMNEQLRSNDEAISRDVLSQTDHNSKASVAEAEVDPKTQQFAQSPTELAAFKTQFSDLASRPTQFHQLLNSVYGSKYDASTAEQLRISVTSNDFSWLPAVQQLKPSDLPDAAAAYSSSQNTIYMRSDLSGTALSASAFTEEVGHHLDTLFGGADTQGDEGALFRVLLSNESVSAAQLEAIATEDDSALLMLDGVQIEVEQFSISMNGIKDKFNKAIVKPFVNYISEPISKGWEEVKEKAQSFVQTAALKLFDYLGEKIKGGLLNFYRRFEDYIKSQFASGVESAVHAIKSLFDKVDTFLGLDKERGLNQSELDILQPVFGDAVDFSSITIKRGGTFASLFNVDNGITIGNDIFMPEQSGGVAIFNTDDSLTSAGQALLLHEVAHVWQFQQFGDGYISDSIGDQLAHQHLGAEDPYDWRTPAAAGVSFAAIGVEQQASLIADLGVAQLYDNANLDGGELNREAFTLTSGVLDDAQWLAVQQAQAALAGEVQTESFAAAATS